MFRFLITSILEYATYNTVSQIANHVAPLQCHGAFLQASDTAPHGPGGDATEGLTKHDEAKPDEASSNDVRGRPLMIWGWARRKSRKKNFGGPSPGKNTSQKAFLRKKWISKGLPQEKINLKRPSLGKINPEKFLWGEKIFRQFFDWLM